MNEHERATDGKCIGSCRECAIEAAFSRGYNLGRTDQKNASPPPKAREIGQQLIKERDTWAEEKERLEVSIRELEDHHDALSDAARAFIEAQSSDSVPVRQLARERLLTAIGAP